MPRFENDDRDEPVEFYCVRLEAQTEKAGLFCLETGTLPDGSTEYEEVWLPWSQVDGEVERDGESGRVYVPLWLAEEKGLV